MSTPGRLIVFEGWDGSGKSTLAKICCDLLNNQGKQARYVAFPGQTGGTLGLHIHRVHHDPACAGINCIHPASLQVLHIAAHIDGIESTILPALDRGEWVILDRFWWSTRAYGIASGVSPQALDMMMELELLYWRSVRPSVVFYISRPSTTSVLRDEFQKRVSAEYERLVQRESRNMLVHRISNEEEARCMAAKLVELAIA